MSEDLKIIKAAYLIGIIADGLWAVALFFPPLFCLLTNNTNLNPDFETRMVMGIAGSLMLGWTLLLVWAYLKPIERRFILLLTAFPVVLCLFVITLISVFNGQTFVLWLSVKTFLIMILMTYSYFRANRMAKKQSIASDKG
jgi:hypothetical protein